MVRGRKRFNKGERAHTTPNACNREERESFNTREREREGDLVEGRELHNPRTRCNKEKRESVRTS
jgi:hypothetical protein